MHNNRMYMELSDGFEFILPANEVNSLSFKFMACAIYDLEENRWVKYRGIFTDEDCKVYEYRSEDESARRQNFDDVPVMGSLELAAAGYMREKRFENIVRHRLDIEEFGRRVKAFKARKIAEGAKFLYIDQDCVRLTAEMKQREEQMKGLEK